MKRVALTSHELFRDISGDPMVEITLHCHEGQTPQGQFIDQVGFRFILSEKALEGLIKNLQLVQEELAKHSLSPEEQKRREIRREIIGN